jgi:hypothetical protein
MAYEGIRTLVHPREMVRNGVWKLLSMEKLIISQRIGSRIKYDGL